MHYFFYSMRYFVLLVFFLNALSHAEAEMDSKVPFVGKILEFSDTKGHHTYRTEIIHYQSIDGAFIEATLLSPNIETPQAGLIFTHMWARDRNTFWGLPEFLATHGYPSIYIDLRGHGKSKYPAPYSNTQVTINDKQKDYFNLYLDILPSIDILNAQQKVKKNNLILIAASLGCPLGVKAVHIYQEKFVGMIHLAPATVYFNVDCRLELKTLRPMPIYVIIESTDSSIRFAKDFFSIPEGYKTIFNINKIGHGTDVLFHNLGFPTIIRSWIQQIETLAPIISKIEKTKVLT